jgi:hydroxymethylglutaryl-CoA synthase
MALASLLESEAAQLEGKRVGLFSYGSGCQAEFFAGTIAAGAGSFAAQLKLSEPLERRRSLSFAEYEAIRQADAAEDRRAAAPGDGGGVRYLGLESEKRRYSLP